MAKAKPTLLVVDDEQNIRRILQVAFEKEGYSTLLADTGHAALKLLSEEHVDLILSDVTMPGMTGYELLQTVKRENPDLPFVLMTAYGTIPQAVQAIRDGAFEYVTKPFDLEALKRVVSSAMRPAGKPAANSSKSASGKFDIIAFSANMIETLELVDQVADSKATVMIGGESGVGKEVIARALHMRSGRANGPFVAVSCAALPETLLESELFGHEKGAFTGANAAKQGRFESADGGTLFLDEIGEIPLSMQVKLLRVLQEREIERLGSSKSTPVDVRVVTATHRDLHTAVEEGTFRLDLLYRLQVVELTIAPLRERPEDIEPLARYFLEKYCRENGRETLSLSSEALGALQAYRWPGNVRELENTMERAVVLASPTASEVSAALLPKPFRSAA